MVGGSDGIPGDLERALSFLMVHSHCMHMGNQQKGQR